MAQAFAPTRVDRLPNGMPVLSRELHHAPLVSVMLWYGVGSRNEQPGLTGVSHFLEHMMFKGTPRFPYGALEEGVKRRGGAWNAFTGYDYTAYYELLPARHLAFGLEVEADRMNNMTFDPDLTVRERGIIVSEREGRENSPHFWLFEAFMAAAYQQFPYNHSVLGHKTDIKATTAASLSEHYRRFYRPNNAILVVTGDFQGDRLLELAHQHFGSISPGDPVQRVTIAEPEQTDERRVTVRRPGPNPYLMAGYKIPGSDHPDYPALRMLGAVLSGAPSFGPMGGGAAMGRSSRLYRKLVNGGIATSAGGQPLSLQYPGLFLFSAVPVPGVTPERLEEELFAEVEALRQERVPDEEIARVRKQVRAQFTYGMEGVISQASALGSMAITGGVERFDRALELLEAVTASDIQRVARTYLDVKRRTVGWFLPEEKSAVSAATADTPPVATSAEGEGSTPVHQKPGDVVPEEPVAGRPGRILDHERIVRRELPSGAVLLVYPTASIPSAFVRVQMEAGAAHDPNGQAGLAQLTAQLMTRGSQAFTAEELALKADALGMAIRVDVGRETAVATLKSLTEDLPKGLELLAEVIRRPVFPSDELERTRNRILVGIRESNNDTRSVAARTLAERLYPEGHPYRHPASGTETSLSALTSEDLAKFHDQHYRPQGAVITVVGNVDADQVEQALAAVLDGWTGGAGRISVPPAEPAAWSRSHMTVAGKSQTDIALGWSLVDRTHPDYLALDLLATLFGGNGTPTSSRLFRDVRERYGLSYYQYAVFTGSLGPSTWTAHIGVSPDRVEFAVEVLLEELKRLAAEPIPAHELDALKSFLEDFPAVQHESSERVASRLAEIERFGLGLDYVDRYPSMVGAVTAAQLQAVAVKYLSPDRMAVVTAGPE